MLLRKQVLIIAVVLLALPLLSSMASAQVSPPYLETFESEPTCGTTCGNVCTLSTTGWLNEPVMDNFDWTVDIGGTGSGSTGPSFDHTLGTSAGKYLYTETSSSCSGGDQFWLWSPPIDLTTSTFPYARFWYHMYGSSMGTLHVDVLDGNNMLILDVIPSLNDNLDAWQVTPDIDLTAYVGQTIQVRLRGISGSSFTSDMAIDDFELFQIFANDVGVSSVDAPVTDCGSGMEAVTITVTNSGGQPQSNFPVQYVLDGGAPVVETFVATIPGGTSQSFTFATLADVSAVGPHTITASTGLATDEDTSNDSAVSNIDTHNVINVFPSTDDFEGGAPGLSWIVGGANASWQLGTPAGAVISGANSGVNAWTTGLSSAYNPNEQSFVQSQHCYDFTGVGAPFLTLALWYDSEPGWDGAIVESSIDNGQTWQTVGAFGDPNNWYNDNSVNGLPLGVGWAGASGGWLNGLSTMFSLGNQPRVRFRVFFGSDSSVHFDGGFAFDDFTIDALVNDDLQITQVGPSSGSLTTYQPGQLNVVTQVLDLFNFGPTAMLPIDSISITQPGNLADAEITAVKLWADNGDGAFSDVADTQIDMQMLAMGQATFMTTGLSVPNTSTQRIFITVDLAANATAGNDFGSQIAMPAMDIMASQAESISVVNPPLDGPLLVVGAIVNTLPFFDDLSGAQPNRSALFQAGTAFPQSFSAGLTAGLGLPTSNDALVELLASNAGLAPLDGSMFFALSFPNGEAVGALDYTFDLSGYTAANDTLWLQYRFADTGEEDDIEDNIFISLDSGTTWAASLYKFDWANPQSLWALQSVDVSAALLALGLDYTNNVVVRFQAGDNEVLNADGLLIDSVFLGRPMEMQVERPLGTIIADESTDAQGDIPALPQSLSYTISNLGDLALAVNPQSFQLVDSTNVNDVTITPPSSSSLDNGMSDSFTVEYLPGLGPFSLELSFSANDPALLDNVFNLTISGTGQPPQPEIDIQRPAGASIQDGGTDWQSTISVGEPQTLTYTIENQGYVQLYITSATVDSESNVTAEVTAQPAQFTMEGASTEMMVQYTVEEEGAFEFDIVVGTNDFDEPFYTITVAGQGEGTTSGAGGAGGAGGSTGATGGMGGSSSGEGGGGAGPDPGDDGGCGCRVAGHDAGEQPAGTLVLLLLGLGLGLRRRRGVA